MTMEKELLYNIVASGVLEHSPQGQIYQKQALALLERTTPLNYRVIAEWAVETCIAWGTEIGTGYIVAGYFIQGLERKKD